MPLDHKAERKIDVAYERIRGEIIRCSLLPGQEVSESSLTAQFDFGKAAVRAALMRLCQEGLVQVIPRRGYLVSPITLKDVLDLFEVRMILEPAAARLAAGKIEAEKLRTIDTRWARSYETARGLLDESALQANKEFHLTIARATRNGRLVALIARVLDETDRLIYLGLPIASERAEIQEGHKPLIHALEQALPEDAERAAAAHIEASKTIVIDALVSSSSLLDASISVFEQT